MRGVPFELTGQRFGRLRVLARNGSHRGYTRWTCLCDCGTRIDAISVYLRDGRTSSCGCLRKDARNWAPNQKGYLRRRSNGREIFQHRYVMERQLGRPLLPHETVHHRNGDRADNRVENLELWSVSQPPGQRVEDKVAWAVELIGLYRPDLLAHERSPLGVKRLVSLTEQQRNDAAARLQAARGRAS